MSFAARRDDPIQHSMAFAGLLGGLIIGAGIGFLCIVGGPIVLTGAAAFTFTAGAVVVATLARLPDWRRRSSRTLSLNNTVLLLKNKLRLNGLFDYRGGNVMHQISDGFACALGPNNCAATHVKGTPLREQAWQRLARDLDPTLLASMGLFVAEAPWLKRSQGLGMAGELRWWRDYLDWATDNDAPDLMIRAFGWLERHQPTDPGPLAISWGDARLSNTICDDTGTIVGVLDWEQACICPAEADLGWWLATRRQMLESQGLQDDPELPGFDSRARVIERYEEMIGRPLRGLEWFEMFSMVRMGCCILRMQMLLRRLGQSDHAFLRAPLLPAWVIDAISVQ